MVQTVSVNKKTPWLYVIFIAVAFVGGIALAWGVQEWRNDQRATSEALAAYGGDFMLEAPWGESGLPDYRGKLVLIYFGFASCPDVCPTALGGIKAALNSLDEAELAKVRGLFITVDPERDTPQRAEEYAQYFHANLHGLSGQPEAVEHVAKQYGVLYRKVPLDESAMGYTMDHSSVIYVVDQRGVLREKVQHGVTPGELAGVVRRYL